MDFWLQLALAGAGGLAAFWRLAAKMGIVETKIDYLREQLARCETRAEDAHRAVDTLRTELAAFRARMDR